MHRGAAGNGPGRHSGDKSWKSSLRPDSGARDITNCAVTMFGDLFMGSLDKHLSKMLEAGLNAFKCVSMGVPSGCGRKVVMSTESGDPSGSSVRKSPEQCPAADASLRNPFLKIPW